MCDFYLGWLASEGHKAVLVSHYGSHLIHQAAWRSHYQVFHLLATYSTAGVASAPM